MAFLKTHKNDLLLILAVLLLAGGFWFFRSLTREAGSAAEVAVDGTVIMTLPLSENTSVIIGEGSHTNTLTVAGGAVSVSAASCPDHVCMDRGTVCHDGETIVCLPNKLVVTVIGGKTGDLDGISR